jgi:hypothetical protein
MTWVGSSVPLAEIGEGYFAPKTPAKYDRVNALRDWRKGAIVAIVAKVDIDRYTGMIIKP